jgi:hypothetical protein
MNNTLHTWQISFGNIVDQNKKTICFLPERKNNDTAHLIAAAPDLLSALQDICAMIVSPNDTRADILAHARTAIAKAEGK